MFADSFAVILAGGSGTRFWPKSRRERPKQLCSFDGSGKTMLELTLSRLDGIIPVERRIIVTHQDQVAATTKVAEGQFGRILVEPEARNTAAALALAALEVEKMASGIENPVMISFHADHLIGSGPGFQQTLEEAVQVAHRGFLTLLGIQPTGPETGFGYIEEAASIDGLPNSFRVASFREKPDQALAEKFLADGRFLWNSGLFVWQVSTLLHEYRQFLPTTLTNLTPLLAARNSITEVPLTELSEVYHQLRAVPVDTAILEKSSHVAVVRARFDWQDIGSWAALDACTEPNSEGNIVIGHSYVDDCQNVTIDSAGGQFIAAIGVKDIVVAAAEDGSILVCHKDHAQRVKKVVGYLKEHDASRC